MGSIVRLKRELSATVCFLLLLTGCQSTFKGDDQTLSLSSLTPAQQAELINLLQNQEENEALLESWKENRDGVERLLLIESELVLLMEQLDNLATEQSQRDAEPPEVKSAEPASSEVSSVVEQTKSNVGLSATEKRYALQLGAFSEPDSLLEHWQNLSNAHAVLVAEKEANYEIVRRNGANLYRLKIGVFASSDEAYTFCRKLQNLELKCILMQYNESDINQLK
ncbi:SPOR domain-containing protein [Lacimicrobium alkaliphilum]|uniref:SPOR domain-containing protein n=1 Tax=Lacimicrobium alkaliphilum TaxID=1526571 RepID=A0ABQ1R5F8_9ALTE|nr:SPOR domain-containing protein [Lacimicrobium alkaliphilum]GGD55537.1 hypothetical protein GCM10011357_08940 [Lacimicrobium alkaliphilum]